MRTCAAFGARRAHAQRDRGLLLVRRLRDDDVHEEAVALRLGQGVDALGLDRVLRREHEERLGQPSGLAADRDLALGHGLEQRGLQLGRAPG